VQSLADEALAASYTSRSIRPSVLPMIVW
jgi:hypothetical protein